MARWLRWWPLTGVAFVGLFLGGFAVTDSSPDSQSDDDKIVNWITSKSDQHKQIATLLMILGASLVFVWFVAMLRERLARADPGSRWPALAFGSGLVATALWIGAAAISAGPSLAANDTHKYQADPNLYRALSDAGYALWFGGTTIALGVVVATGIVALRTGLLPRWLAWLSFPVALTMLVSFFFVPFLIMCGWILVVGVTLIVRKEAPEAAAAPAR
jgi:hypothetical protein